MAKVGAYADWEAVLAFSTANLRLSEQDVEELRSERTIKSTKTKEEIERLMVDESLDLLERSIFLLRSGQKVQKVNAVENLKSLLSEKQAETLEKFVPCVKDSLHHGTEDLHIVASRVFSDVADSQTLSGAVYARSLLPIILDNISNYNLGVANNAWLDALLASLPFLPSKTINDQILNVARSMGTLSKTVSSRLSCCKLLGKLAINLDQMSVKRDLLKLVTSLCQDVEMEVRAAMCQQLDCVAKGVGLELTKNTILPELVELTKDEQMVVREAGIETVSNILNLLDDESCVDIVIPLVQDYCQKVLDKQNEEEVITVAKHIGKLCYGLAVNLTTDQKESFLDCYRRLCECGDPANSPRVSSPKKQFNTKGFHVCDDRKAECRKWCAYNFPAILLFDKAENFSSSLLNTFQQMINDPNTTVRRTMACGLHEVCKILCNNVGLVQGEIKTLLQDDSMEVLEGLIPHLSVILETLAKEGTTPSSTSPAVMSDFTAPLLNCELCISLSSNWRLHVQYLEMMACLPNCLTSDQIYYKFVPVLFRLLSSNRVVPIKRAAGRTLCVFIKHNKRGEQRQELCKRIIQELGKGKSHRARLVFLDICQFIMEFFSKAFFKEHFFELALLLGQDPVVNVRLRVCNMFPALKSLIKLPGERPLLQTLEQNVRQLMTNENDRDVSNSIRNAVMKMDRIQLARDNSVFDSAKEEDAMDRIKEDQEKQILEDERKHDSLVNRITSSQSSPSNNNKRTNPSSSSSKDLTKRALNKTQNKLKDLNAKQAASKSDGNINVGTGSTTSLSGKSPNARRTSQQTTNITRASSFTPGDAKHKTVRSTVSMKVTSSRTGKTTGIDAKTTTSKKTINLQNSKRS